MAGECEDWFDKLRCLAELNNDVENLLSSSRIGTLLLDKNLEIRKYSPEITKIFHIMEKDIGWPLNHLPHRLIDSDVMGLTRRVLDDTEAIEREVASGNGSCSLMRMLPYHIGPDTFSGITFIDVTALKNTQDRLDQSAKDYQKLFETMAQGVVYRNADGKIIAANPAAERILGLTVDQMKGRTSTFEDITDRVETIRTGATTGMPAYRTADREIQ